MTRRLRVGVLASGSGTNLQAILDACREGRVSAEVVLVLSNKPDAGALDRARRAGVPAEAVPSKGLTREAHEEELIARLDAHQVDLVCLAGYLRLLTPRFIGHYRGRLVNIHPALLPAFPGLDSQRQALEYGVKIAGCTTHFVTEDVDAGPIILQAAVPVLEGDTEETLKARILEQEHRIYPRTIQLIAEGRIRLEGRRVLTGSPPPGSRALVNPEA
ncbi:MAG TPA: phosphoribosylglycinamide formyltransferase [Candidatus Thermoplasmatota archaeon]|nr:phosphoribosylglycinamide formyltransferase [Candidatus Thermoplasmatota archaeon]